MEWQVNGVIALGKQGKNGVVLDRKADVTDRELLERAARACGLNLEWNDDGYPGYYGKWRGLPQWEHWNPLGSDGDALRLAVRLKLCVNFLSTLNDPLNETDVRGLVRGHDVSAAEQHKADPYAATRRAIVRAAAEMGGKE